MEVLLEPSSLDKVLLMKIPAIMIAGRGGGWKKAGRVVWDHHPEKNETSANQKEGPKGEQIFGIY